MNIIDDSFVMLFHKINKQGNEFLIQIVYKS
jgi:hypothetical protein